MWRLDLSCRLWRQVGGCGAFWNSRVALQALIEVADDLEARDHGPSVAEGLFGILFLGVRRKVEQLWQRQFRWRAEPIAGFLVESQLPIAPFHGLQSLGDKNQDVLAA